MAKENACSQCMMLSSGKICPNCHSTNLTANWSGMVIILDAEKSEVAKTLKIDQPGRYAIRVN